MIYNILQQKKVYLVALDIVIILQKITLKGTCKEKNLLILVLLQLVLFIIENFYCQHILIILIVIFLVVFWIFREFTDLLCVCLEKWCSCKYNLHSRIIVRRSHAGVLCDACGSWIRSPTRHAVRSPLYFNSVVTIAPNCRIVERKIMPL